MEKTPRHCSHGAVSPCLNEWKKRPDTAGRLQIVSCFRRPSSLPFRLSHFASLHRRGTYSAFRGAVHLFDILQAAFHRPLTPTLVEGLFQAGCLGRHAGGDPALETEGPMIDELLPLLKYRTSRQFTRRLPAARRRRPFRLSLPAAIPLVFLGAAASVLIGCFLFTPRPSMAGPILTGVTSRATSSASVLEKKQSKKRTALRRSPLDGAGALVVVASAAETGDLR